MNLEDNIKMNLRDTCFEPEEK